MAEEGKFPRLDFFETTPLANAIKTKFVEDRSGVRVPIVDGVASPHPHTMQHVTNDTGQSIRDAENVFATQPDIEIAMSVLVSAIMSPTNLREVDLTWTSDVPELPSELINNLLEYLRSYHEDDYKIKEMIEPMLKDCLFKTGSYPVVVLPESAIDDIINNRDPSSAALEDFKQLALTPDGISKPLGILGNNNVGVAKSQVSHEAAMEARFSSHAKVQPPTLAKMDKYLYITDNPECLKLPRLMAKLASQKIANTTIRSKSLEAVAERTGADIKKVMSALKVQRNYSGRTIQRVNTMAASSRQAIGHPLTINLSSASVIPAHLPSDPSNPLGFFVLIDPLTGHEITEKSAREYVGTMNSMARNTDTNSMMLERTGFLSAGLSESSNTRRTTDELIAAFSKEFERDIGERFVNGVYGQKVEFPRVTEFYRIMFARTLANQHTQILYIPSELMTYFAFDYNDMGIGRSMLDKMKILANIRSVLLFGNVMGAMKNSVPHRNLTINLDEHDPEPEKSVEMMMTEYAKVQSAGLAIDSSSPRDLIDGIRRSATSVIVTGNSAYPDISMSVEDTNSNRAMVDNDLSERIDKRFFQGFSLTPELVDSTSNIEFASVALNSSLLFTKRVAMIQAIASPLLADHVVKYTLNSGTLILGMIDIIKEYQSKVKKTKDESDAESELAKTEEIAAAAATPVEIPEFGAEVDPNAPPPAAPAPVAPVIEPTEPAEFYSVSDITGTTAAKAKEEGLAQTDSNVSDDWMEVINDFLNGLQISLPAPDNTKLANQIEQFNQYAQALDAVLPMHVNEEILKTIIGTDNEETVTSIMEMIKGYFLRDFAARNNIMPELGKLVKSMVVDEKPFDIFEEHTQHVDGIAQTLAGLLNNLRDKNTPPEGGDDMDAPDTGGETEDTDAGGDGGFGGDDDFGGLDDFDVEEEPADAATTDDKEEEPAATEEPAPEVEEASTEEAPDETETPDEPA